MGSPVVSRGSMMSLEHFGTSQRLFREFQRVLRGFRGTSGVLKGFSDISRERGYRGSHGNFRRFEEVPEDLRDVSGGLRELLGVL